jgi:hypothetical protein
MVGELRIFPTAEPEAQSYRTKVPIGRVQVLAILVSIQTPHHDAVKQRSKSMVDNHTERVG